MLATLFFMHLKTCWFWNISIIGLKSELEFEIVVDFLKKINPYRKPVRNPLVLYERYLNYYLQCTSLQNYSIIHKKYEYYGCKFHRIMNNKHASNFM